MTDLPQPPSPENPVQFGPTRAVLTIFDFNPPAVVFLDAQNNAVATQGIPEHLYESVRLGLATALGPLSTPAEEPQVPTSGLPRGGLTEEEQDEQYRQMAADLAAERGGHREQSGERGKGKGKGKKGKKGKPDWAGNKNHPDHPRNRKPKDEDESESPESADTPDEPADEDEIPVEPPVEPLPDVVDPDSLEGTDNVGDLNLNADPVPGDIDLRDDKAFQPVTVHATAEVVPALFEQWYSETYPNDPRLNGDYPDPALHPDLVREYLADTQN